MKQMRKQLATLLAIAMVLTLAAPVWAGGNSTKNADITLSIEAGGSNEYTAQKGTTVCVIVSLEAGNVPVAEMNVTYHLAAPLEIVDVVSNNAEAYKNAKIYKDEYELSLFVNGYEPVSGQVGKSVFKIEVAIPEATKSGSYKVTFSSIKVYKEHGTSDTWDVSVKDLLIKVEDGPGDVLYGDANNDGQVDMADVVALNKWLHDAASYNLKAQGKKNANCCDVEKSADPDSNDCEAIQQYLLYGITKLPCGASDLNKDRTINKTVSSYRQPYGGNPGGDDADVRFSFVDSEGNDTVTVAPGAEATVPVSVTIDGGDNPIAAIDAQFACSDGISISAISNESEAVGDVMSNIGALLANMANGTGDSVKVEKGKPVFHLTVKVPANAPEGDYTVGFSEHCRVYKGTTKDICSTSFTPLTISVEKPANFSVTVTSGANMTQADGSGALTQTITNGAIMTPVIFSAKDNCYFPEDYTVASAAGISVSRDSFTQITVSGTPTANAAIVLTDASAKTQEEAPDAAFTATGADTGKLSALAANTAYTLSGAGVASGTAITADANGDHVIASGLAAGTLSVVKNGNGTTTVDSPAQTITVTKAAAPDAVTAVNCVSSEDNDGKLVGVTAAMEYKKSGADSWTDGTGDDVTDLVPGTYLVRVKAAGTALGSDAAALVINGHMPSGRPSSSAGAAVGTGASAAEKTEINSGESVTADELSKLAESGQTLTVAAGDGTKVELDAAALKDIAEKTEGRVTIRLEESAAGSAADSGQGGAAAGGQSGTVAYDLTVTSGGETIDFDGKVTLTPAGTAGEAETGAPGSSGMPLRSASITDPGGSRHIVVSSEPFPYADVPTGSYYYKAVDWADLLGITTGIGEGSFGPAQPCTRGQMVTFLWRAAGCPEPQTAADPFGDLDPDAYYYKAVLWAYENGIALGTGEGGFRPDLTVSRAMSVTFLYRALGGKAAQDSPFRDVDPDAYYAEAVAWAAENGITLGTSEEIFSPDDDCVRAQIVTFLYRACGGE